MGLLSPGVKAPGPLIASGRDSDIFDYGPHLVLRRYRDGRPMADEARTMQYLLEQGYPVPAIDSVSDDGTAVSMQRIEGLSMVDAMAKAPWTVRRQGRLLAELHTRLHEIAAPAFLRSAPVGDGSGESFLHLDLHPLNVIISPSGPVVIDWTGASRGDPDVDVVLAWLLMASGEIPGSKTRARILGLGRSLLVNSFTRAFDMAALGPKMRSVLEWKSKDAHMSPSELANMRKLVERHAS
jgi:aminoglycoside phosphotransferase (APT) family kinase protein